jgi:hypothetical protein
MKRAWLALVMALVACRTSAPTGVSALLKTPQPELDKLFMASPPGPIPSGAAEGTALVQPGTQWSPEVAAFIHTFGWKGKVFDAANGTLINRLGATGTEAIVAKVYQGKSLIDGKDCIVLDYSTTSVAAHHIRDEIRMIAPNTYLGPVYWDNKKLFYFALKFDDGNAGGGTPPVQPARTPAFRSRNL